MQIVKFKPGAALLDTPNIKARVDELAPGATYTEQGYPGSDEMFYFSGGSGVVEAGGETHPFSDGMQAYIPAGTSYRLTNTGNTPVRLIWAQSPNAAASPPPGAGGPLWVVKGTSNERFPASPHVRGGMLAFPPDFECDYHSHDDAEEIFLFLKGQCRIDVEGEVEDVGVDDIVIVPAEHKHKLKSGSDPLLMWLTVTPNLKPSHTFYKVQPDGSYLRITPRAGQG